MQHEIHQRLKRFAIETIKLAKELPRVPGVYRIADQLVGSGTSPAANAREATAARSKQEFISCMGISLKELNEVEFWLEIIIDLEWAKNANPDILLRECRELHSIVSTIILNAKDNIKV